MSADWFQNIIDNRRGIDEAARKIGVEAMQRLTANAKDEERRTLERIRRNYGDRSD